MPIKRIQSTLLVTNSKLLGANCAFRASELSPYQQRQIALMQIMAGCRLSGQKRAAVNSCNESMRKSSKIVFIEKNIFSVDIIFQVFYCRGALSMPKLWHYFVTCSIYVIHKCVVFFIGWSKTFVTNAEKILRDALFDSLCPYGRSHLDGQPETLWWWGRFLRRIGYLGASGKCRNNTNQDVHT